MKTKLSIYRISKHFFYLLLAAGLLSCNAYNEDKEVNELKCPVLLFAKSNEEGNKKAAITLIDGDGKLTSFVCNQALSASIHNTYSVGDTIRDCR